MTVRNASIAGGLCTAAISSRHDAVWASTSSTDSPRSPASRSARRATAADAVICSAISRGTL
jgi:hypothetical protein